jgi:hypothetical protein
MSEPPAPMRCEQWRQSGWASTDNNYTCPTKAQSHLLRRTCNAGDALNIWGIVWGNAHVGLAGQGSAFAR